MSPHPALLSDLVWLNIEPATTLQLQRGQGERLPDTSLVRYLRLRHWESQEDKDTKLELSWSLGWQPLLSRGWGCSENADLCEWANRGSMSQWSTAPDSSCSIPLISIVHSWLGLRTQEAKGAVPRSHRSFQRQCPSGASEDGSRAQVFLKHVVEIPIGCMCAAAYQGPQ